MGVDWELLWRKRPFQYSADEAAEMERGDGPVEKVERKMERRERT